MVQSYSGFADMSTAPYGANWVPSQWNTDGSLVSGTGFANFGNLLPTQPSNTSSVMGGLGNLGGILSAGSGILQGLGGLAGAYTAYKGLQLARDQFGFQKGLANRNLANQAKIANNAYDNAGQVALGMVGSGSYNPATDSQGSYGGMASKEVQDRYAQSARDKHLDGSPIK